MDHITMNKKEREQPSVFEKLKIKEIKLIKTGYQLDISTR